MSKNSNFFSNLKLETRIGILDWSILLSILLLLTVVYIPSSIWMEEKKDRDESRFRMKAISNAANFYKELKGVYSSDGLEIFSLVEAAIDSLYADSLFTGKQKITIGDVIHHIDIDKGFDYRADTTFSIPEKIKTSIVDTIYMVEEFTDSLLKTTKDTTFVNSQMISETKNSPLFSKIIKQEISDRIEVKNDYLRRKYHLNEKLLFCPLTKRPYILEVLEDDDNEQFFIVKSPVKKTDAESRYIFFKYDPGNHGYIKSGITSWAE